MTQHNAHRKQYRQAREAFDGLKMEDRAVFLLEATFSTVARGVEEAGRALADELDQVFRSFRAERPAEPAEPPRGTETPGPAEPPTAKQTAPRSRKKRKDDGHNKSGA